MASPARAAMNRRYFKTGPGEYGEGDRFVGLAVPQVRELAARYGGLPFADSLRLVRSSVHEERLLGLLLWVERYRRGAESEKARLYRSYVRNLRYINNWDLIDCTAEHIVGAHLAERSKASLMRWAASEDLWERRVSIMATFGYIKRGRFEETLRLARRLLGDNHDLIHKAVGWMLREIGNRDRGVEEAFLRKHYRRMPRTMLRYAIERFPERRRRAYLEGRI